MQPIRRIVVGIAAEGTPLACREASRHGFEWGVRLAEGTGAEILLVTAMDAPVETESLLDDGEHAFPQLQQLHRQLGESAGEGVVVRSQITQGPAGRELIRAVLREQADLLIVGPGRGGTLRQVLFGSTALEVLRKCPSPVWVNRSRPAGDVVVLAADDFTEIGELVLDTAVTIAQILDARLLALHAVPTEQEIPGEKLTEAEAVARREKLHREAEHELARRLSATDYRTLPQGGQTRIEHNEPENVIPHVVNEFHVSLVVMGTLARSGIGGLLLGNTAERLMGELSCSILAIKPEGFVSPVTLGE